MRALVGEVAFLSAMVTSAFLLAACWFFRSEFANFNDVYVHGVGIMSRSGNIARGGVRGSGFAFKVRGLSSPVGNFVSAFPLGLEFEYSVIPSIYVSGNGIHGIDSSHQESGNSIDDVFNKNIGMNFAF